MAHLDLRPATASVTGVVEPRQSTVSVIQRGVRLGFFTAAEADLMIGRIRALATRSPLSTESGYPFAGDGYAAGSLLHDPNRTV